MLTLNDRTVSLVCLKSFATYPIAGANILDARGETRVIALISASNAHFLGGGKFCGFARSS